MNNIYFGFCLIVNFQIRILLGSMQLTDAIFPTDYNKYQAPTRGNKFKTHVTVMFFPVNVLAMSAKTMDMTIDGMVLVTWTDNRLNWPERVKNSRHKIKLQGALAAKMWNPFIFFSNCKGCDRNLRKPDDDIIYDPSWNIISIWVSRMHSFICRFDMRRYPFDTQKCAVQLSYFDENEELDVLFGNFIQLSQVNVPPEFKIIAAIDGNCTGHSIISICHSYELTLRRIRTRPILLIFIPSMLVVMVSWISFWLDPTAAAPRVALGLTAILTLATHFNAAQRDLPAVSTIMALDVWMFSCIFTVFASLIEFAIVNYCQENRDKNFVMPFHVTRQRKRLNCVSLQTLLGGIVRAKTIDKTARLLFPFCFSIFNVVYWNHYYLE